MNLQVKKRARFIVSDSSDENLESILLSSGKEEYFLDEESLPNAKSAYISISGLSRLRKLCNEPKTGDFVAVIYENQWFVATFTTIKINVLSTNVLKLFLYVYLML